MGSQPAGHLLAVAGWRGHTGRGNTERGQSCLGGGVISKWEMGFGGGNNVQSGHVQGAGNCDDSRRCLGLGKRLISGRS